MKKITYLCLFFIVFSLTTFAQEAVTYQEAFQNLTFEFPVEIQNSGDSSNRLFVVEQSGKIKVFDNDPSTSQQRVFLDLTNEVSFSSGQEIGLLGLAFHPEYNQNGYFYVYYTRYSSVANVGVEIVIARYNAGTNNPNQADVSSRLEILSFDKNQEHSNHNGGKIGFGPDGYLYASFGDGGGGGDPNRNAQNLDNPFGSILRIDVDVDGNNPLESNPDLPNGNYEIPNDNPRVGNSGMDELYAWGIRNTWKFSFDTNTNNMWGADVGQGEFEEINLIQKGGNYGWNRYEANADYTTSTGLATSPHLGPIYQYDHDNGDLSITGGYVYRGSSNNPDLQGKYIYGDYVSGRVWSLDYNSGNNSATSKLLFRTNGEYVSSFGLDESGELYFSGYGDSAKIFKIIGGDENTDPSNTVVDGIGSWQDIENGTNGNIEAVITSGDDLFVAGNFTTAGTIAANNIAVYNKTEGWKILSSGANGSVNALAVASNGNLYAGGEFTNIGGVEANNIAVWNGSTWSPLGTGTSGSVAKIKVDKNDNVYVGGAFENAGGIIVHNIAKWNNGWSPLTDSGTLISGTNNEIRSIALDHNGRLIVGGNFDSAGGKTANRIATWNGSNWGTLGEGTSGFVEAILVQSGYIYAGGNFTLAGGKTVNRIARWNITSKSWEGLGNGTSGNVNALATDGTHIYLGGNFETVSDAAESNYLMSNMARWSEASGFEALGTSKNVGTDNQVNSIYFSANGNDLYVGGNFNAAGNSTSSKLAVWSQNFNCSDADISMEYSLNGINWISGDSRITVDEGTSVQIRKRGLGSTYTITLPNGTVHSGSYDLGIINPDQAGVYRITGNDGCSRAFEIFVISDGDTCPTGSIVPQYQVNGTWFKGYNNLSVQPGAEVVLSMYPEDIGLEITLPSGEVVGDEHSLGAVTTANNGTYILTSEEGCTTEINLTVNEGTSSCDEILIPEYRINGKWSNGEDVITINQGSEVIFSMLPNGVAMALTLPDGTIVEDNHKISNFSSSQAGTYLLTSAQGCSKALEVNVVDECEDVSVVPQYRVDGIWSQGETTLVVDEGSDVVLSMFPENIGLTIVRPDGTLVADNYAMRSIRLEQAGVYTFFSEEGCSATLDITVNDSVNCSAESIIPEYRVDGIWKSGQNYLRVGVGSDILLSMLPNDIGLTITTPDGRQVADNYSLRNVTNEDSGVYVLRSSEGCKTTLTLDVSNLGTGKSSPFDEFQGDFKNYHSVKNEFAVYPNPTMDEATMDIQNLQGRPLGVVLSNMQQQTLISEKLTEDHSSSLTFDMSNLPPGIYIVKLTLDDGEIITRKIIKKR